MYVWHNFEVCLCNHCCSGKAISVKCYKCVSSLLHLCCALFYSHLWPDWLYHSFPHHPINGTIFGEECYWTYNVCFDFHYNFCWNVSHSKDNSARYYKCTYVFTYSICYSCQISVKLQFLWQTFWKSSNIKFHENPSRRTDGRMNRWTDMTKLIVALHNFSNVFAYCTVSTDW